MNQPCPWGTGLAAANSGCGALRLVLAEELGLPELDWPRRDESGCGALRLVLAAELGLPTLLSSQGVPGL